MGKKISIPESIKGTVDKEQIINLLVGIGNENIRYQPCANSISNMDMNTKHTVLTFYTEKSNFKNNKVGILFYFDIAYLKSVIIPFSNDGKGLIEILNEIDNKDLDMSFINNNIKSIRNDKEDDDSVIVKFNAPRNAIDLGNIKGVPPIMGNHFKMGFIVWVDGDKFKN